MSQKNQQPPVTVMNPESDWRTGKPTVNERHAHLLETGIGADVYFLVGKPGDVQELIAAHKFVLSAGSSVFERQFSFGNAIHTQEGTEEKPIEVVDVEPPAFRAMLKHIYADDFGGVTKQNVMEVYYAAKKYMLDHLAEQCRLSLSDGRNMDAGNALSLLKHAQHYEDQELINHCWSYVDVYAKMIIDSESEEFLALNQQELCELFSRDRLAIEELYLFNCLLDWAINKCKAAGLERTVENMRNMVGEAIYRIRFPLMSVGEFTQEIVPTRLLNRKDIIALYVHFTGDKRQYPNHFNGQRRPVPTEFPPSP